MGLRVFLTGASGYLGSVLTEHLAQVPEIERITGIDVAAPTTPLPPKVGYVEMDIRSPDLADAMAGHQVVVHTAFVIWWLAKMPMAERDDINLNGVRNVAQGAVASKVRRFVHTSSIAAYDREAVRGRENVTEGFPIGKGDSPLYYWNGKAVSERILVDVLASSGVTLTILRPSKVIGPRNTMTVSGFRNNAVRYPGRDPRFQFVHEEDVAAAFAQAVCADMSGSYNVVPDDHVRWSQAQEIIGLRSAPTVPAWLARLVMGIRWRYLNSPTHPSWYDHTLVDHTASNAKLKATGWCPRYGSAQALHTAL